MGTWARSQRRLIASNEGRLLLRGIPFQLGSDPQRCYLLLGDGQSATIQVRSKAHWLVFAHVLLDSAVHDGQEPGAEVGFYRLRYRNGRLERIPIRERFEAAWVPPETAVNPGLLARGFGPTRFAFLTFSARPYQLWAWRNPRPEIEIVSLELHGVGRPYLLAGLTLGLSSEDPVARSDARIVLLSSPPARGGRRRPRTIEVDRGMVDGPYQTQPPATTSEAPGWGVAAAPHPSLYARIQASPSATITVRQGRDAIAIPWQELAATGSLERAGLRVRLVDPGRNWVRVSVVDADSGRPLPCRVRFTNEDGIPFPPHGHREEIPAGEEGATIAADLQLGGHTYAYIDGECEGWLPRGEVRVEAARGFEYEPLSSTFTIGEADRELVLPMRRIANLRAEGWVSGDSHVHSLSTQGAHLCAASEDLGVVNLLQLQDVETGRHRYSSVEEFTGQPSMSSDGQTIVHVGQENRLQPLGHLVLWGLRRPVPPLSADSAHERQPFGVLEETMSGWADVSHERGGTVILAHHPNPESDEAAAMIATGRVDALELVWQHVAGHAEYYRYLSAGYRLPLVGGTDRVSCRTPVGLYRTYARLGSAAFDYENWTAAVRAGRTFLSSGPLLELRVDGANIGDTIRVVAGATVRVSAAARSIFPIQTLQIVVGGSVVEQSTSATGARRLDLTADVRIDDDTWISARCGGPDYRDDATTHHDEWRRGLFAHTSPIYVSTGDSWSMFDASTLTHMRLLVEGCLRHVRERAPLARSSHVTHRHGEDDHLAYLERPLIEAHEALSRRLSQGRTERRV